MKRVGAADGWLLSCVTWLAFGLAACSSSSNPGGGGGVANGSGGTNGPSGSGGTAAGTTTGGGTTSAGATGGANAGGINNAGGTTGTGTGTGTGGAIGIGGAVVGGAGLGNGDGYNLPSDRLTIWKPGVTYNGGIPARTTIFRTLMPSGGNDTTAIQSAITACPTDQVVMLGPGTFMISGSGLSLAKSNITLRGSGPNSTKLVQASGASSPVISVGSRGYTWSAQTAFIGDALKETNTVILAGNPGLQVGEIVHVDETYDPALTYFDPSMQNGDYQGWGEGRKGAQAQSRPIGQAMEVASITGNIVTFTTNFHITFRMSHAAHLARLSGGGTLGTPTKMSGIENLAVSNGGGGDQGGNIRVFAAAYCWAKNIESSQSSGASFAFDGSFRCEVRDSYLHSTVDPNPGGLGYGLVFDSYTADSLAENNISWNFNKVMAMRSTGGGNVIAYNYMEDAYGAGYAATVETGLNASHMAGSHYELFEGNQAFNFDADTTWGNEIYITAFRNHLTTLRRSLTGVQTPLTDQGNRRGIGLTIHQWWYSFVGNVIGYPDGYLQSPTIGHAYPATFGPQPQSSTFRYEWLGGNFGATPIWQIGYNGANFGSTQDTEVQMRTLRDGNYDYFTKSVRWHGIGGTGTGGAASPLPLPASLYTRAKPAFFGANPWPWTDGSSATTPLPGTLPARTRMDAGTPNVVP